MGRTGRRLRQTFPGRQDPAYLAERYGLGEDQLAPLNAPAKIASALDGR
ncbi:hypothetical protein AB0J14_15750 [Micromonospora arborensis]